MRMSHCTILLGLIVAGCAPPEHRPLVSDSSLVAEVHRSVADCLGRDSLVHIDIGQIGALRLDLPIRELRQLCPNIRDTIASVGEAIDTAIVISRPGLAVVGRIATIGSDEGPYPYHVDSSRVIHRWTVTGSAGLLPGGVPLSATWDSLLHAFGRPRVIPLNGNVLVSFCERLPDIAFNFDDRLYLMKPELVSPDSYPSSLAGAHIRSVDLSALSHPHACDQ